MSCAEMRLWQHLKLLSSLWPYTPLRVSGRKSKPLAQRNILKRAFQSPLTALKLGFLNSSQGSFQQDPTNLLFLSQEPISNP